MRVDVVVVGAGFGGLAAAVELARRGERVLVLERASEVGGKARTIAVDGRAIDVGPTVLTMRWVFDEMFAACGRRLDAAIGLVPSPLVARHEFPGGATLDLFSDVERTADAIGAFAGRAEAAAYRRFAAHGAEIARTVEQPFLRSARPSMSSLVLGTSRLGLAALAKIDAHRTMWRAICSFFEDPRLRALFARYATYVGSSPFEAPATLNLIAHVEREGVAAVEGGVSRLARAVADLARSLGVEIVTESSVREVTVENGRATGVIVEHADGAREEIHARAVIANADVTTIARGALGKRAAEAVPAPSKGRRSLSAITWAIAGRVSGFDLAHHNVFFSNDYAAEHRSLFDQRRLPDDPTVYVCAQDRLGEETKTDTDEVERLLLIANAPATADTDPLSTEEIDRCERTIIERLSRAGLCLEQVATVVSTPMTFERLAPGTGGAIYGEVSHGALAPLSRPASRTKLRGLYLTGGGVHPGPGVPMAALSGRAAAIAVTEDLASTTRSTRVAITGSISMR